MKTEILFISDLHLSLEKPELTRHFLHFLAQRAPQAAKLYILGDLFDAWVGDDDFTPPSSKIREALKNLVNSGTEVFLQPGNRDFLMGDEFAKQTGLQLLADYAVIDLGGNPTLLTHGDLLCSDDHAYQTFRTLSRTATWRDNVLSKPLWLRLLAARWYRLRSFWHKRNKSQDIMDVNHETVCEQMRSFRVHQLIHGHTHRPQTHHFHIDHQPAQRVVLAQWSTHAIEILCWNSHELLREVFYHAKNA